MSRSNLESESLEFQGSTPYDTAGTWKSELAFGITNNSHYNEVIAIQDNVPVPDYITLLALCLASRRVDYEADL